ncbi:MAG TPA: nitrilase-related carbon-nitrogen hydrolase [Opitutaceae bacterium]|jgi:apolipoprotein N-acyltransferase
MEPSAPSIRRQAALLAASFILALFANGRFAVSACEWLYPMFLLRYTRDLRRWRAWLPAWIACSVVAAFQFWTMYPIPPPARVGVCAFTGFMGMTPYWFDRWVSRRWPGFLGSLALPCAVAARDLGLAHVSSFGTWGSCGYTQLGNLPLLQVAALAGLPGIAFLVSWPAAVANWAWERRKRAAAMLPKGLVAVAAVYAAVFCYGESRLIDNRPADSSVRMAGITPDDDAPIFPNYAVQQRFWSGAALAPAESSAIQANFDAITDTLCARTRREADAGAHLVVWSEAAAWTMRTHETQLAARLADLARTQNIFLGATVHSVAPGETKPARNELYLFGPDGSRLFQYLKSRLVPGPEAEGTETNGNPVPVVATSLGRISGQICFDLDFPQWAAATGRGGADLLISPANDWREIDPWHTRMISVRAIENGCSLLRCTSHGRSIAVDRFGRTLATSDYFAGDRSIVAMVPLKGRETVYARTGDLFGVVCVAASALLAIIPLIVSPKIS